MTVLKLHNPIFGSVTVGLVSAFLMFRSYQEGRGIYFLRDLDSSRCKRKEELSPSIKEELSAYNYLAECDGNLKSTQSADGRHLAHAARSKNGDCKENDHGALVEKPVLIYEYVFAFDEAKCGPSAHEAILNEQIHMWAA
eukprot:gene18765-21356_t